MTVLLLIAQLLAAETALLHPRNTEGVAAGIGELQSDLQDCVSESTGTEFVLVHLRFTVDVQGRVGSVESVLSGSDPALEACMAEPFSHLQFDPGEQEMPVEVPISVQRSHTEQTTVREE